MIIEQGLKVLEQFHDYLLGLGYEYDPDMSDRLDSFVYGKGTTGGADPQWREAVIIQGDGSWRYGDAHETYKHGSGFDELVLYFTN